MTGHKDEIAEKCLQIYRTAMGVPALLSTDEFSHAGGDSVKAVLIASELEIAFGVEIPMATFFEKKTVAEMSDWLSAAGAPS
jgi:surfactin family lipopeptide synthetase A/lichenysin synthetase A